MPAGQREVTVLIRCRTWMNPAHAGPNRQTWIFRATEGVTGTRHGHANHPEIRTAGEVRICVGLDQPSRV